MKIRTDFVTNSSSANYLLDVVMVGENEEIAFTSLAVSPETCWSADGDMSADDISLYASQNADDVYIGKHAIHKAKDIEELIDWIYEDAEVEGYWPRHGESEDNLPGDEPKKEQPVAEDEKHESEEKDDEENDEDEDDDWDDYDEDNRIESVSLARICPKEKAIFKKMAKENGLTIENLKHITIKNSKYGNGDSAMYVEEDAFSEYKKRYDKAETQEEKDAILKELTEFANSKPVVEVCDNEFCLDDEMQVEFLASEEDIEEEMKKMLEGKRRRNYWMGEDAWVYGVNVKERTVDAEHMLLLEVD